MLLSNFTQDTGRLILLQLRTDLGHSALLCEGYVALRSSDGDEYVTMDNILFTMNDLLLLEVRASLNSSLHLSMVCRTTTEASVRVLHSVGLAESEAGVLSCMELYVPAASLSYEGSVSLLYLTILCIYTMLLLLLALHWQRAKMRKGHGGNTPHRKRRPDRLRYDDFTVPAGDPNDWTWGNVSREEKRDHDLS